MRCCRHRRGYMNAAIGTRSEQRSAQAAGSWVLGGNRKPVSRRAAHVWLRCGFIFRASSQGARNGGTCRRASSQSKAHPPFKTPSPLNAGSRSAAKQWTHHHPPHPPVHQSLKGFIAAHEDIICVLLEHPFHRPAPGKAAFLPYLQPPPPFLPNLHILCVLFTYVSAMVCV